VFINLGERMVNFATGSYKLDSKTAAKVKELGAFLSTLSIDSLTIVGHTDIQGTDKINNPLSERRAKTVSDILISQGVQAKSLTVEGRGSREPVDKANTRSAYARNRRVNIKIEGVSNLDAQKLKSKLEELWPESMKATPSRM
jgi:outer membrane protein OmpA-like peptidoglycan-associated protein